MARQKDSMDEFWDRVEKEIYLQKKSKKKVAERCGFDRKVLIYKGNLSASYLARLCVELNVSADYLLFGNEWETEETK